MSPRSLTCKLGGRSCAASAVPRPRPRPKQELAKLINDLAFDVPAAIEEYVGIAATSHPERLSVSRPRRWQRGLSGLGTFGSLPVGHMG